MINFSKIDLTDNKLLLTLFFLLLLIFILSKVSINLIIIFIFLILLFLLYQYMNKDKKIDKKIDNKEVDTYYNNNIKKLIKKLKKYKHLSPYNYIKGISLWKVFIKHLEKLEDKKLYNYSQYFENAYFNLKTSINTFMEISTNSNELKYIDGMEYGDFDNSKELKTISNIVKELYKEGYNLLLNVSGVLNKKWNESPNIHNKEIIFNTPEPMEYGKMRKYEFY